ncbi:hypothetical protein J7T55_011798 [Diaporthe amygdali]|uniref:uncharacterized protein n=1 Tax=Phomopsis amygdali TaxID=1214568 RepID=UPI0022FDC2CF|nr:uncharacterized protein J7T55_011798 [Diaporthe amygdali]KAJ0123333.1 hypothetical protein J7T55_011798 [Diaporthe amygdali]
MVSSPLATSRPPDRRPFAHIESFPFTLPSRADSWTARDDIVRRFSDSAPKPEKEETDKNIKHAVDAYHDAIVQLKQVLKTDDLDNILSSSSTVTELHKVAIGIQNAQANVLEQRQIARFVDTINHYSGVFDVLSQCAFGYMTLIWGSLKFVLLMAKSHYDTLFKFTDVMCQIGINLPRVELYRQIFPTARILQFVSQLYAAIVEFLQEFIVYLKQKSYRKFFGNFTRPFDLQFGRLVGRIQSLEQTIDKDAYASAILLQVTQSQSMARHRVDLSIRRTHNEGCLSDVPDIAVSPYLLDMKKALFHGFEIEASYHEELATTFKMTSSKAWASWLSIEQQYVPSKFSHKTTMVQAECDAPDAATCLQWVTQVRAESPHIVSVFLLWARGMTAQSAIASIVFQMVQQRPAVLQRAGLSMKSFSAANASLPKLWDLFLTLVQHLGGLMVYISIGSVGQEEFGIVAWFVDLCQKWSGPPLNVVIIHPFDENFVHIENCVDLDDKYDVHPSLTTSDALYHVVLLELEVQEALSETVQLVLWEALWREVRYAVIGIAVTSTVDEIIKCAKELIEERGCEEDVMSRWVSTVMKWTNDNRAFHIMREQIQRHLNIVDIHLPQVVRTRLERMVSSAAGSRLSTRERRRLTKELREGEPKPLDDDERGAIWRRIQDVIKPATMDTYNASIGMLMRRVLDAYLDDPPESESDAKRSVKELMRGVFGWNKTWKAEFLDDQSPILESMVTAIDMGFGDVLDAIIVEVGI